MPLRPRVQLDGLPLHIVQRGHKRETDYAQRTLPLLFKTFKFQEVVA